MILNFDFCNPLDIILFMDELQYNLLTLYNFYIYCDQDEYKYNKTNIKLILEGNENIFISLENSKFGKWDSEKNIFYLNLKFFENYNNIDNITMIEINYNELNNNMELILNDKNDEIKENKDFDNNICYIIDNLCEHLNNIKLLYKSLDNFYSNKNYLINKNLN